MALFPTQLQHEQRIGKTIEQSAFPADVISEDTSVVISRLRKSFASPAGETVEVLREVSCAIDGGQSAAIMGVSGAGKSTLLQLVGGLESADGGLVKLGNFSVTNANPDRLAGFRNQHVGFVFQFHHLLPDLSARENVALPLMIGRKSKAEANSAATSALEAIGLSERLDHLVGNLSGGEQQRVAVCRALITDPRFVLADEPTGNLDQNSGEEITNMLLSYGRRTSASIIIATHSLRVARQCDRLFHLENGKLLSESNEA